MQDRKKSEKALNESQLAIEKQKLLIQLATEIKEKIKQLDNDNYLTSLENIKNSLDVQIQSIEKFMCKVKETHTEAGSLTNFSKVKQQLDNELKEAMKDLQELKDILKNILEQSARRNLKMKELAEITSKQNSVIDMYTNEEIQSDIENIQNGMKAINDFNNDIKKLSGKIFTLNTAVNQKLKGIKSALQKEMVLIRIKQNQFKKSSSLIIEYTNAQSVDRNQIFLKIIADITGNESVLDYYENVFTNAKSTFKLFELDMDKVGIEAEPELIEVAVTILGANMQKCEVISKLGEKLTEVYKNDHEKLRKAVDKQINYFKEEYKSELNKLGYTEKSNSYIDRVDAALLHTEPGQAINIDHHPKLKPLANQIEATLRTHAALHRDDNATEYNRSSESLRYYRNGTVGAMQSLAKKHNGSQKTDYEIIMQDNNPLATFFKGVLNIVASALCYGVAFTATRAFSSYQKNNYFDFLRPRDDFNKAIEVVNKNLGIQKFKI